jgi:hypothetical protein
MANAIDPEGRRVVFHEGDPGTGRQSLGVLPIERDGNQGWKAGTPATLVGGPFLKSYGRISPDGKWMAYSANDTGRFEIYVQPFPGPGERLQVSSGGGSLAAWSKTKSELYYTAAREGRLMAVAYTASDAGFRPEKPRPWSDTVFSSTPPVGLYGPGWDMHPDSQRFAVAPAMTGADTGRSGQVALLFNFFDELRRVAPVR